MNRSKATRPEFVAARQFRKKTSALRILRRAVDHCQELVFLTDAEGILQYVNPSCEAVTGYSAGQLIDKNLTWIAPEVSQGETWDLDSPDKPWKKGLFAARLDYAANMAKWSNLISQSRRFVTRAVRQRAWHGRGRWLRGSRRSKTTPRVPQRWNLWAPLPAASPMTSIIC